MSWSDTRCARVHNPGKRWHVAKAGDGRRRRAEQATRMRMPIGVRRRRADVWAPCGLLQRGDGATLAELVAPTGWLHRLAAAAFWRRGSSEKSARVNLSKAFQDAALEAVSRALFSIPESGDKAPWVLGLQAASARSVHPRLGRTGVRAIPTSWAARAISPSAIHALTLLLDHSVGAGHD